MSNIKIKYTSKHKGTGEIVTELLTLDYIEKAPADKFNLENWEIVSREVVLQDTIENNYGPDNVGTSEDNYLSAKVDSLEYIRSEIIEIIAGMEGFKPETAPEAYLLKIINDINKVAVENG